MKKKVLAQAVEEETLPEEEDYGFSPTSKRQWQFITSTADIIVYGGSMGSGKSYMGLLKHLQHIHDPHYRGVIVRKTFKSLMDQGYLFDEAVGLYSAYVRALYGGKHTLEVNRSRGFVRFPSGASISFKKFGDHKDMENWKGAQFTIGMCDESTELEEDWVWRIHSRIGRSKAKIKPQLILTCNPIPDSFLRKWVDWWLIPKGMPHAGRVDPEKNCKIRYFIRHGNDMAWADTKQELIQKYGFPNLPEDHKLQIKPLSVQFIGATIYDNPKLIERNPEYLTSLQNMKAVEKERNLFGNWNVRAEAAGYWKREWITEIIEPPAPHEIERIVRAYDIAATLKSETQPDPDYTVGVKMAKLRTGQYVVLDVVRYRCRAGDVIRKILETAYEDGNKVDILIPQDPNAGGKVAAQHFAMSIIEEGYVCLVEKNPAMSGKLDRFRPFSAACLNGKVDFVVGCSDCLENNIQNNNEFVYSELESFTGGRNEHNDICDAMASAFFHLANKFTLPSNLAGSLGKIDFTNNSPLYNM